VAKGKKASLYELFCLSGASDTRNAHRTTTTYQSTRTVLRTPRQAAARRDITTSILISDVCLIDTFLDLFFKKKEEVKEEY
jgi:hypothetical protein